MYKYLFNNYFEHFYNLEIILPIVDKFKGKINDVIYS